jgi:hypothetical protein
MDGELATIFWAVILVVVFGVIIVSEIIWVAMARDLARRIEDLEREIRQLTS